MRHRPGPDCVEGDVEAVGVEANRAVEGEACGDHGARCGRGVEGDAADALAVAICHYHHQGIERRVLVTEGGSP